jgi:hypothetical protein
LDGRWVTLAHDGGAVIVRASDGQRERVSSYEGAMDLAKQWRR